MSRYMRWVLSVALLVSGERAWACSLDYGRRTDHVFPASISAPRDLPVGGVIYDTHGWVGAGEAYVKCMELGWHHMSTGFLSSPAAVPGLKGVYATNLEGIGVKVAWARSASNLPASIDGGEIMHGNRPRSQIPRDHYAPAQRFWIQLIKTNEKPSSGTLRVNPVRIYYDNELTNEVEFTPSVLAFTMRGCRLPLSNIEMELPMAFLNDFKGKGSTARPREFGIPLACDPGVRVSYSIAGLQDEPSVLKNSAGPTLAKGVGVQLLRGNSDMRPILLGEKTLFGDSGPEGGNTAIPIYARYYQTEDKVSPGSIHILATLSLFYE